MFTNVFSVPEPERNFSRMVEVLAVVKAAAPAWTETYKYGRSKVPI